MFRDIPLLLRFVALLSAGLVVGCSGSAPQPVNDSSSASKPAVPAAPPAIPDLGAALADSPAKQQESAAPDAQSPPPVEEERQVAVAGVGRKGKNYGGGIISTPVSAYFGARERIAFIAVTDAMRKFHAEHDRDPASHEEFMEQIIEANGIQLPALFAAERYEYDPETGELMVVRPKK